MKKIIAACVMCCLPYAGLMAQEALNPDLNEALSAVVLTPAQQLQEMILRHPNFMADFSQDVTNEMGQLVERSTGKIWIQQPHNFRWHTMTPYQQIVIGDQTTVSSYDIDLDQVILQSTANLLGESPALLLTGKQQITELFNVEQIASGRDYSESYLLRPKKKQGGLEKVRILFKEHLLARMEITDSLGQITFVDFQKVQTPDSIPDPLFKLNLGPDVDIIDQRKDNTTL